MMEPSASLVGEYLRASEQTLEEAKLLFGKGFLKGAGNRAYYAMFYAASASLLATGLTLPKKHKTTIAFFYHHLVETGIVERSYYTYLTRASRLRQQSDYHLQIHIGTSDVKETIDHAALFLAEVERVIGARDKLDD